MVEFTDKLITLSNLRTYTDALKTDINNPTIVHKSTTTAADGTYSMYVLDGTDLKPLDTK